MEQPGGPAVGHSFLQEAVQVLEELLALGAVGPLHGHAVGLGWVHGLSSKGIRVFPLHLQNEI